MSSRGPAPLERAGANLSRISAEQARADHARAAAGTPVAWVAIIVPIELLHGFDLVAAVPENHSALCAAKGAGAELAAAAEAAGSSADICSYARIALGWSESGARAPPVRGLPRRALLISDLNNCSLLVKWFEAQQRRLGVDHFVLDVPFCIQPQQAHHRAYIRRQLEALVERLQALCGRRFDRQRCARALQRSDEALALWRQLLELAARRPAAISAFDTFAHMAPFITGLRGSQTLVEHYRLLLDEARERAAAGGAAVAPERYRLLWDNIAPWHQLRRMSQRLAGLGANIVAATYTACMGTVEGGRPIRYAGGDPLDHLARIQNFSVCPYGLALREQAMAGLVERFAVDGVVFASNRSCKVYSVMQLDLERRIAARCRVPTARIDIDHADPRAYDEEQAFNRLEALLETIAAGRQPS